MRPILRRYMPFEPDTPYGFTLLLGFVFLCASTTEWIGVHALFGAFVAGLVIPRSQVLTRFISPRLEAFTGILLLPLFFAFTGLRTSVGLLRGGSAWLVCALVILVAVAGKLLGCAVSARATGASWRDAFSVGILMNARGLVELVILNVGLDLGIISRLMFSILVVMALLTTMMTAPLLNLFYLKVRSAQPEFDAGSVTALLARPGHSSPDRSIISNLWHLDLCYLLNTRARVQNACPTVELRRRAGATLVEDPQWELAILATVQSFYQNLMANYLGGTPPIPAGLDPESISHAEWNLRETLTSLRRWLQLLDLAITPAMLRNALAPDTDPEVAEAMLRYFARKEPSDDSDRDKTDLVVTFLYRNPRVSGQWDRRGFGLDGSLPLSPFEIALLEILSESDTPLMPPEHLHDLRVLETMREEFQAFPDFHSLLDSGIIQRARQLKRGLGASFYHPAVLATIAPYNTAFGQKFDALYHSAAAEIKRFAATLEQMGGSILSTVDGVDVTVEQVSAFEEDELLKVDYGIALDKFQRVSRLGKELDRHPPVRPPAVAEAQPVGASPRSRRNPIPINVRTSVNRAPSPQQMAGEEARIRRVEESIRTFVRVADPRFRHVVPMRFFNLILSPEEVDAACGAYLDEKSPRGETGRALMRIAALNARITTELEELKRSQNSSTLWKLHADSLVALLNLAQALDSDARNTMASQPHSDGSKLDQAVQLSLGKLSETAAQATRCLAQAAV